MMWGVIQELVRAVAVLVGLRHLLRPFLVGLVPYVDEDTLDFLLLIAARRRHFALAI